MLPNPARLRKLRDHARSLRFAPCLQLVAICQRDSILYPLLLSYMIR